jgi:phosphoglycerate dehydrogenase-like enzyme
MPQHDSPPYEAVFMCEPEKRDFLARVFGDGRRERVEAQLAVFPEIVGAADFDRVAPALAGIRYIFGSGGMPGLTAGQIARLPALEAVFCAAGSVQYFARPFIESDVKVVSAFRSIAMPVAAYTVSLIVLASKGYFTGIRQCRTHAGRLLGRPDYPGISDATIAVLGAGTIGTMVIEALRQHPYKVVVFDPYLGEARAAELGVERVSLDAAFERGFVVTNHIAHLKTTEGLLRGDLFARMPANATFINTGRGATVAEEGMLDALEARPDLTALIDVTAPEPPRPESRLFGLPNVFLTPHIAGSQGKEVLLQADYAIEEFERYRRGMDLRYAVTAKMLETMA